MRMNDDDKTLNSYKKENLEQKRTCKGLQLENKNINYNSPLFVLII